MILCRLLAHQSYLRAERAATDRLQKIKQLHSLLHSLCDCCLFSNMSHGLETHLDAVSKPNLQLTILARRCTKVQYFLGRNCVLWGDDGERKFELVCGENLSIAVCQCHHRRSSPRLQQKNRATCNQWITLLNCLWLGHD